jgi:N4-gp56 family major capsid protein
MLNTLDNLEPEVATQMVMVMLSRPMPDLIASPGNYYISIGQNRGNIARQSRYENLPTQPAPLGPSGANPPPMTLNRLDTDAQIQWYGGYVAITEQVLLINQDDVLEETLGLLAQSARETDDQLQREHMVNTSAFINCVNGGNGDNPTNLSLPDLSDLNAVLRGAVAKYIFDEIDGADKFGSGPIRNSYMAKTHTDMCVEFDRLEGFITTNAYPTQDQLYAEWGSVSNFRFFLSSVWPITPNASLKGNDVYNIICQGMEAVSYIDLDGYSLQYRWTPPRIAGGPLWLYGTSGFIFAQAPKITNTTWIQNLRCTLLVP